MHFRCKTTRLNKMIEERRGGFTLNESDAGKSKWRLAKQISCCPVQLHTGDDV
jgi:hypothetical protein